MSVLSVACPTCLMGEGVECINMFAHPTVHIDPHSSRFALYKYGPEALGVFTGDLGADPDERIKPLGSFTPAERRKTKTRISLGPVELPHTDARMDDGTIIRWDREWPDGMTYPYAAIKTEVGWWLTGRTDEPMNWHSLVVHHLHFAERVEVAFDWRIIKEA